MKNKLKNSKFLKTLYAFIIVILGYVTIQFGDDGINIIFSIPDETPLVEDSVAILDVGQADSAVISSGGHICLIDAGSTEDGTTDAVTYLEGMGVNKIDIMVITHFHSDHTNNVLDVMNKFEVETIIIPNLTKANTPTTSFFKKFLNKAEEQNVNLVPAKKGDVYYLGNGTLTILDDTHNDLGVNSTSVATLFKQGEFTYLNTGDGEKEYEARLLKVFSEKVTLFAAGHHGSSTSNTKALLTAINPDYLAISCGEDNEYGHPHREVMELIKENNIPYNITFEKGTLVYSIN